MVVESFWRKKVMKEAEDTAKQGKSRDQATQFMMKYYYTTRDKINLDS